MTANSALKVCEIPCEELKPDHPPHKILDALARYARAESVALVGHRPQLHDVASYFLTGNTEGARPDWKKAVWGASPSTIRRNQAGDTSSGCSRRRRCGP